MEPGAHEGFPADSVYVAKVSILFYANPSSEDVSEAFQADLVDIVHLVDDERKILQKWRFGDPLGMYM